MKTTYIATLAGMALLASSQAALIGEYTFNDTGAGTVEQRMPVAMGATNMAAGVSLAPLGTNTTTQLGFGGFNNLPPTDGFDGFSFGNNSGNSLLWVKRAALNNPSAFNQADTSAAVQPLHIMVSADASHEVAVSNIVVALGGGSATIFAIQESGAARGGTTTIDVNSGWAGTISLDAPVVVAAGTTKSFTIYMNTGSFESTTWFDNIAVNGSVTAIPEPAMLGLFGLAALGAFAARRFKI